MSDLSKSTPHSCTTSSRSDPTSPQVHLMSSLLLQSPNSPFQRTTMLTLSITLPLMGFLTHVSTRKTIHVAVGQHGLQFVPNTIVADAGDVVQFNFYNVHSVVQSSFRSPCQPLNGGLYSGIIPSCLDCGASPQRFLHTVETADPIWIYCSSR